MRLDSYLFSKGYYSSRNKASEGISRGEVKVNGKVANKASLDVSDNACIEIERDKVPYVSLGGYKLEKAIETFKPNVKGCTFIDIGASTGGFTDCLLRAGAEKIFCVDVGQCLLNSRIANDERTVVMDRTNARYITEKDFGGKVDGVVADCSFISIEYILPVMAELIKDDGYIIVLIKPQFELGEKTKMKGGIVKGANMHEAIVKRIYDFACSIGLYVCDFTNAPITEGKNIEYLMLLRKTENSLKFEIISEKIKEITK